MKKFISISKFPGNNGKNHYEKFFKYYDLNYTYTPISSTDIKFDLEKNINDGISGISISMPFKTDVLSFLDFKDKKVLEFNTCNTILIKNNKLYGYNTDFYGLKYIYTLIKQYQTISILGNGSIANMFKNFLKSHNVTLFARSLGNWDKRHIDCDVYINCTALGTISSQSPLNFLPKCKVVVDLSINYDNDLHAQCELANIKYISGKEFYKHQFFKQFKLYTDININEKTYNKVIS